MTAPADCLEETAVVAFLDGALAPEARASVEEHVATCTACAELVTWAAADQAANTARQPGHEGRPFVGQLHPGSRVGRYQILGALGRGGMGEVYAAYHPDLDRRIALKVVHGSGGGTRERRARLLREARAIARLSHPNVVTVHDAGTFGDRVFIAMELIDGQTIDQWLRHEPRAWRDVLDVFIAAGRGLAAAHAAGVVHRDFKPQNVMLAKNGVVRVMDFGLARLAQEEARETRPADEDEPAVNMGRVTRTGAFVGTPAYMSPEQFRHEATDARSDQFSFCVALHEALFGTRPATASAEGGSSMDSDQEQSPRSNVPSWLRAIVVRGASVDRERRYESMEQLLSALEDGRKRLRRRVSAVAVGAAVALIAVGAWRLADANRFVCAVPRDRVAAAWSTAAADDPRRQSIHRAFAASGRPSTETTWARVSSALDDHMNAWQAMYLQTCEATHVRGEQSSEVLDLRMSCLNDNLDQVRALTDALVTADGNVVAHAVTAATDLTPVDRCADVALLKSAVPLPKDERTLRVVQRLRRSLAEVEALRVVGRLEAALAQGTAIRAEVEATGYPPLLGELLERIGLIQSCSHLDAAEATLEEAFFTAEAARDDETAARAATSLIYTVGMDFGRLHESERWSRLANAILDRLGHGQSRLRGWAMNNRAAVLSANGDMNAAIDLIEKAIALKKDALGTDHPDVAISLDGSGWMLIRLGRPGDALDRLAQAISILENHADPNGYELVSAWINRGEALLALDRPGEARDSFQRADALLKSGSETSMPNVADVLAGTGRIELAEGRPAKAVPLLERGLEIYIRYPGYASTIADIQFALAQALSQTNRDRTRTVELALAARETYRRQHDVRRENDVEVWLASYRPR